MINKSKKHLLILPCSKVKKQLTGVQAIELYDGPFYKVLRKNYPNNLNVLILSAKYGLISSDKIISYYDQIMTINRAEELSSEIKVKLEYTVRNECYDEIFISLGKTYMFAIDESKNFLDKYNVYWGYGQIGERLHQLKEWTIKIKSGDRAFS